MQPAIAEAPVASFVPLMIAAGFALGMTAPIEVLYAKRFGADNLAVGAYVMCSAAGVLLVDLFGTRVVPRLPARTALIVGIMIFGGSSVLHGATPTFLPLLLGRFAQGFASAVLGGAALQLAVRVNTSRERAVGSVQGALMLGSAIGAPVGGVIAALLPGTAGYRLAFVVCAAVCVAVAIGLRSTFPPLPSTLRPRIGLPRFGGARAVRMALVLGMLGNYLRSGVENAALPLVGAARGFSTATIGVAIGLLSVVEIATLRASGRLMERVSPTRCLVAALGIGIAGAFLLALFTSLPAFIIAAIIFGCVDAIAMVAPPLVIMALSRDAVSGLASYRIACGVGSLVGSTSVTATVGAAGESSALAMVGVMLLAAIALAIKIGRRLAAVPPGEATIQHGA